MNLRRLRLMQHALIFGFAILWLRVCFLIIFPQESERLEKVSEMQYERTIKMTGYRGHIVDRRGLPLALSVRKPSFFVNPRVFSPNDTQIRSLSKSLKISRRKIRTIAKKKNHFAWLKRKTDRYTAESIRKLEIKGLHEITEPARFYPSTSASHLVGYVNIDDRGRAGLEKQYQDLLGGPELSLKLRRDGKGRILFDGREEAAPARGGSMLKLTIDRVLQDMAQEALLLGIMNAKAKGGSILVGDPHTGAILAMVMAPQFDPNRRPLRIKNARNQILNDHFEPGSVIKALVISEALDKGIVKTTTQFDCEDGVHEAGGVRFRDSHKPETKLLTVAETLITSSNVCTYKIAQQLGAEGMDKAFRRFGVGEKKFLSGYPAETRGQLAPWEKWRPIRFANLAFGQGLVVTSTEILAAYSAIANGGHLVRPFLVDEIEGPLGNKQKLGRREVIRPVISAKTAETMRQLLAQSVSNGAKKAIVSGYTTAGKTGTSQKIDPKTKAYSHKLHRALFAGMAPANQPHLVVLVVIDEPSQPLHYGALWAAPVFSDFVGKALRYLNVAPDRQVAEGNTLEPKRAAL